MQEMYALHIVPRINVRLGDREKREEKCEQQNKQLHFPRPMGSKHKVLSIKH